MEKDSCRICLSRHQEDFVSVFGTLDENLLISDCLQFVCSLELNETDDYPKYICPVCLEKVRIAYEVKVQSIETERFLKKCLESDAKSVDLDASIEYQEEEESPEEQEIKEEYILYINASDSDVKTIYPSNPHSPTAKPNNKCFICHKTFQQKIRKLEHIEQEHENGGAHQCTVCDYILKTAKKLDSHLKYHYHPPEFVCELCGKGFAKKVGQFEAYFKNLKHFFKI
jgi:hypothetical protein